MPEKDGRLPSSRSQGDDGSGGESRDNGKRASEEKRASESGGSSGSGQLPSQEESSDGGRLPSREKEEGADGEGPPPAPPASGTTGPEAASSPPAEDHTEESPRSERIQRAIDTGGLDELPKDFGNPDDGDWQIARSENPFERLYLDHRREEKITSEMVRRHFELISSFWKNKIQTLDGGREQQARQIRRKYGGPHNDGKVARGHLEQTEQAYEKLKDDEGRNRWYRKLEESRREEGREALRPLLRQSLRDGVLDPSEAEGLFEAGHEAGLQKEEVADLLKRKLSERNFESWGDPQGDTLAERLRSVQWLSPERCEEKREEAQKQREATSAPALKIGEGKARSVSELVELCDQNWNEAQDALFHGYLESWISEQLGEMKLTREVREIRERYDDERKKGLEKVVRLFCTAGTPARDPTPQLSLTPEFVDFEDCPVGVRRTALLQFALDGPRRAWGIIEQRGNLPGLEAPDGFEITHSKVELQLDTLHVDPGTYEGKVVVAPEGGAEVPVPVRYRVTPLEIELTPPKLALGSIAHGKGTNSTLQVTSTPSEGRLVGTASLDPPVEGMQLSGELDGSASTLDLAVDTAELQAGSTYETSVRMNTNAGKIDVPVSFQVTLDWLTVGGWTAGLAAVGGGLMWLIRYLLADAAPILGEWFLSFSWEAQGPATLLCILVFLTVGVVAWWRYKTKGEERETGKAVLQSGN